MQNIFLRAAARQHVLTGRPWIQETTKNLNQVGRPRDLNPDLPNASLVRYHGATSLGYPCFTP